ncbi:unhealthy ribosome biogenesis protein 2 homolog [Limulus polyphemus]|uniref:Unhealthy ribosome biogenesis protein 2 homolog n=1 Tax=Limulus polyphemus TaxID=6850 RepID=A0ABM1T3Y6_LIMPO|nr:unhealthy ribosome biogenesis protein 2 homolog [Limulus polyphemus]
MALSLDLIQNLNCNSPLLKRIQLAKELYINDALCIPRKKEIILNWFSDLISCQHQKDKYDKRREENLHIWESFNSILELECNAKTRPLLKSSFAQVILEAVQELEKDWKENLGSIVLRCCQTILLSSSVTSVFSLKFDLLVSLLAGVVKLVMLVDETWNNSIVEEVSSLLDTVVNQLESLQKPNQIEVTAQVIKEVFEPVIIVHLQASKHEHLNLKKSVKKLVLFINSVFFHRDHLEKFERILNGSSTESESNNKYPEILFEKIVALLNGESTCITVNSDVLKLSTVEFLPEILKSFAFKTRNFDNYPVLKFAVLLCNIIGIEVISQFSSDYSLFPDQQKVNLSIDLKIRGIAEILRSCTEVKIDTSYIQQSSKEKRGFFKWCQNVLEWLLNNTRLNKCPALFQSLDALLKLSPLIIEPSIVKVFQTLWLQCGQLDEETRTHQTDFLCHLLSTYSRLRQIPKFLSKLFHAVKTITEEKTASQISPLSSCLPAAFMIKFTESVLMLPFGQTLNAWNVFLDTITVLLNKYKTGKEKPEVCECLKIVTTIFHSFLLHARLTDEILPPVALPEVEKLMEVLQQCVIDLFNVYKDHNTVPGLGWSFLILCYTWGEAHLLLKTYRSAYKMDWSAQPVTEPLRTGDCSLLHHYFPAEEFENLLDIQSDELTFHYFKVLLYTQKVRAILILLDCIPAVVRKTLRSVAAYLVKIAIQLIDIDSCVSWNGQISNITVENFQVPLWHHLLEHLPVILPYLGPKKIANLSDLMVNILIESTEQSLPSGELTLYIVTKHFIMTSIFQELRSLQTAFVGSLWKYAEKLFQGSKRKNDEQRSDGLTEKLFTHLSGKSKLWSEFANTTPKVTNVSKGMESYNNMWLEVQEAACILNQWMNLKVHSKRKIKLEKILMLLKVHSCLPLESLFPGNQIRCLLGLTTLLFSVRDCLMTGRFHGDVCEITIEICVAFVSILAGVRSVWLFPFVEPVPLLTCVLDSLAVIIDKEKNSSMLDTLRTWNSHFINSLIKLAIRDVSVKNNLQDIVKYISEELYSEERSGKKDIIVKAAIILLSHLAEVSQRLHMKPQLNETCNKMLQEISTVLDTWLHRCPLKNWSQLDEHIQSLVLDGFGVLVELSCKGKVSAKKWKKNLNAVLHLVYESLHQPVCNFYQKKSSLKVLIVICSNKVHIDKLPTHFVESTWNTLIQHLLESDTDLMTNQSVIHTTSENYQNSTRLFQTSFGENSLKIALDQKKDLNSVIFSSETTFSYEDSLRTSQNVLDLPEIEFKALSSIVKTCNENEFEKALQHLLEESNTILGKQQLSDKIPCLIHIWKLLLKLDLEHGQQKLLSRVFQTVIFQLQFLTAYMSTAPNFSIVLLPVLDLMTVALWKGKMFLSSQSAISCLHACEYSNLMNLANQPKCYASVFGAVCGVLNELLIQHLHTVLAAVPPFSSCVSLLLRSMVQAADQTIVNSCEIYLQQELHTCTQNLERLLTLLSAQKMELSKLAPYLVADYVSEAQKVTIHPVLKKSIVLGIFRVLDVCSSHSLSMLQATLSSGAKEIFKVLHDDYHKFHRYKGHV